MRETHRWIVLALLSACKAGSNVSEETDPTNPTGETSPPTAATNPVPADLALAKVSLYQGVESILVEDGAYPTKRQAPVMAGREALVRVFLDPEDTFDARDVTAVLTASSDAGEVVLEVTDAVESASKDDKLGTTLNFYLAADQIDASTELSVALREATPDGPGGGDEGATSWSSADAIPGGLPIEATDGVTVVVVPVVYDADGSGRVPDTSQATLDAYRDAMYRIYPASSITMRVGDEVHWDKAVSATNPFQWQSLLDEISGIRGDADETPNTYYYGLFVPDESFEAFCSQGCIGGLSELGFNTTNPSLRTSIGVGFVEVAAETMVHEVGHAHGRFHADCGGAAGTDPNYPYPDALIGSWGYDILNDELKDPTVYTDFMGYCPDIWISNYNYVSLWERISALAAQSSARSGMARVSRMRTDGAGHTWLTGSVRVGDPAAGGIVVQVDELDPRGVKRATVTGWMSPNDHFPGGTVILDHLLPDGWTTQVHDP
ncbi:MAG: M66 family metalloprotease [Myxococcota bacterium]